MQAHTYPNVPFDSAVESLKTPPFSKEAEQSVLGGLMLNNEAWISIADLLTEKDFHLQAHQILFRAIKSLSEEGHPCDNTPSAANIIAYAEIVRERSILRQLMRVGSDIAEAALNTQGRTTTELLDQAEKKVFEIAEFGSRNQNGFVQLKDIVETTFERIDMLSQQEGMLTGIATGFTDLDVQTAGLQKSDLVIVAGRPSMGKTSFAMNIAEHVAVKEQLPVAVFSMEMSNEQLAMRLISSLAAVNLQSVRTGSLTDDDWPKIINAVSQLSEAPLFIDDTPALSPIELRSRARRLAREKGQLGLIVVDYLQLMQIPGNKENRVNEVSEIARSLKSLAKEVNVPVMALSQLNRSLEQRTNKHPVMSDLRESGEIEQSADLIVFIYRDEVYNEDSADKGIAEIIIGKQRNGPIGIVRLAFQGHLTQFKNYIPELYKIT